MRATPRKDGKFAQAIEAVSSGANIWSKKVCPWSPNLNHRAMLIAALSTNINISGFQISKNVSNRGYLIILRKYMQSLFLTCQ
jgi:hypothetical protein